MKQDLCRVRIDSDEELRAQLDGLNNDRTPRLVQDEDGTVLAVLMHRDHFAELTGIPKSRINRDRILKYAGIWSDLDADQMIADIYRWREEAPPSPDPSPYFLDEEEDAENK